MTRAGLASACTQGLSFAMLFALALQCASSAARAQTWSLTENQIKAGFLFNFTKFVEWPAESFAGADSPAVLCTVGNNTVAKLLTDMAAGKVVNGRPVIVKEVTGAPELRTCQIVFVGAADGEHTTKILEALKELSVLTVGESPGFIQAGGMINFFVEENKVRLEIAPETAARVRVKISAKVIAVARQTPQSATKGKT